jgi:polysaccharide export outer membrane protein
MGGSWRGLLSPDAWHLSRIGGFLALVALAALAAGCSTPSLNLPTSGPTAARIAGAAPGAAGQPEPASAAIGLVSVTEAVARLLAARVQRDSFAEAFGQATPSGLRLGVGDVVEVTVWEAPPALLFAAAVSPAETRGALSGARASALPEQPVGAKGTINVPFVGAVQAAGRATDEVEADVVARLAGKANRPQVMVRLLRNVSSNVTVVGEVATSLRVPLSPRGERLLDALAAAGGVRQPVGRVTLQLTRGQMVRAMPLDTIIRDPRQNVPLLPGDVLTALHQPLSLTVFGATGRNEELSFEAQGISLTQALARAGGLQDARADPQGVFVFRFEDPAVFEAAVAGARRGQTVAAGQADAASAVSRTPDGRVPVIYQLDLRDPASFFAAQSFPVQHRDVLYVSNASGAELQKFLNIVTAIAAPVLGVINVTR